MDARRWPGGYGYFSILDGAGPGEDQDRVEPGFDADHLGAFLLAHPGKSTGSPGKDPALATATSTLPLLNWNK